VEDYLEEQDPQERHLFGGKDGDGQVSVEMSGDEMEVWGDFIPPRENGRQLLADDLLLGLQAIGVVFGLQTKTINEAVFQLNTSCKPLKHVLLAKGKKPKKETPAHLQLAKHLFDHSFGPKDSLHDLKNVDHKDLKPFVLVKRGELLARAIPPVEGEEGSTVTGTPIPPEKKRHSFSETRGQMPLQPR
jgi:uncharacterized protein (DUF342 family)